MSTDSHTDGNEPAGMMQQIFAVEVTSVMRICHSCRDRQPIGAHPAYHGAATVLRCPSCGDVAMRIGERNGSVLMEWRGTFEVERPAAATG